MRARSLNFAFYQASQAEFSETHPQAAVAEFREADLPAAFEAIVTTRARVGPFFVTHPDYHGEFNTTALRDWSACQTAPLESFLRQPERVIMEADEIENWKYSEVPQWPQNPTSTIQSPSAIYEDV
jgi:hypothetical protein